jgi:membrane protease YdiL (CAAX protease family)
MSDESTPIAPTILPPPLLPPLPEARPRVWTSLVLGVVALVAMLFAGGIAGFIAVVAGGGFDPQKLSSGQTDYLGAIEQMVAHVWGIALVVLPGQFTMLCAALGAACLSPEKVCNRLGYVRGFHRWWVLPLLLLGTMFAGIAGGLATEALFTEDSADLRMFIAMARIPDHREFIGALLLLSVVPAFVEESLFRGYIQRRLLQRWSPAAAIATSTAFFTLAHFDLQHMFSVIPLGVWLAYLAWRTGTLWPGMLCHAAQNIFALLASRYGDPTERGLTPDLIPLLAVSGLAFAGAIFFLRRTKISAVNK